MRITDIRVLGHTLSSAAIEVETDEAITGIGITQAPPHIIAALVEEGAGSLRAMLIGEDPRETGRLWQKMFHAWPAQRGRGAEGGLCVNAMGAIDMALWDIAGKAAGRPIYQLLGGAVQTQLMAYASASAFKASSYEKGTVWVHKSAAELAADCRALVRQGFRAVKFGWGNHFGPEDEEKLAAIREAIGPATRLMVDFGCPAYWEPAWDLKGAIRAGRILERYGAYFFEEPLQPRDVAGFAALTQALDVRVATGESLSTVYEFQPFIEGRALDIVQPDAAQMGITQTWQVARMAEAAGLLCIPHSPWSALVIAAHLHVLVTLRNTTMIEYPALATFEEGSHTRKTVAIYLDEIVEHPLTLRDGYLQLPAGAGLGLGDFVPAAFARLEALA